MAHMYVKSIWSTYHCSSLLEYLKYSCCCGCHAYHFGFLVCHDIWPLSTCGFKCSLFGFHLAMTVPQEVASKIEALLKDESQGMLQRWKDIKKLLLDSGCAYMTRATAESFVIHPANRGGVLLNPMALHQKGKDIVLAGGDVSMLSHATAFELDPVDAKRQVQLQPMVELASSSSLVPPVLGKERFATVSCSHTCQFVKAVKLGCKTNEERLQDQAGHLGPHVYQKDKDLKSMVEEGWDWLILPHWVETQFKSLPAFAQQALNISNHIHSLQSEMELALSILKCASALPAGSFDWNKVAMNCCTGGPVANYAGLLGKLVQKYSGWLFCVAKRFCLNIMNLSIYKIKVAKWLHDMSSILHITTVQLLHQQVKVSLWSSWRASQETMLPT